MHDYSSEYAGTFDNLHEAGASSDQDILWLVVAFSEIWRVFMVSVSRGRLLQYRDVGCTCNDWGSRHFALETNYSEIINNFIVRHFQYVTLQSQAFLKLLKWKCFATPPPTSQPPTSDNGDVNFVLQSKSREKSKNRKNQAFSKVSKSRRFSTVSKGRRGVRWNPFSGIVGRRVLLVFCSTTCNDVHQLWVVILFDYVFDDFIMDIFFGARL